MFLPAVKEKIKNTWREWSISFGLVVLVLALFGRLIHADFINCDDPDYVSHNPHVTNGLTWRNLLWAFQIGPGHASNWHPLTWLSHMLDCQLFGVNAGAHHAVNIFFHAANTVILFWLLRRMTSRVWECALVAAIFALHPLRLESVAWISERKDLLSTFLGLWSLWFYVSYTQAASSTTGARFGRYGASLFFFALALMAKPMMVTLPFLFILIDFWPLNRLPALRQLPKLIVEKTPFVLLTAVSCWLTLLAQTRAMISLAGIPFRDRVGNAVVSYARYLRKIFWPNDLAFFYPHPVHWPSTILAGAVIVFVTITAAAILLRKSKPYLLVGWCWFVGMLVPTVGLVQVGSQSMADRYTYLPIVGIAIAIIWFARDLLTKPLFRQIAFGGAMAAVASFCVVSSQLASCWMSPITLFEHALRVGPDNFVIRHNLANAFSNSGYYEEAMPHYRKALEMFPNSPLVLFHMGNNFVHRSKFDEALECYHKSISIQPDADTYFVMANTYALMRRYTEAGEAFENALRLDPNFPEAHLNYGNALLQQHKFGPAMEHYVQTRALFPELPELHLSLSAWHALQRQWADAVAELQEALHWRSNYPEACNDLAWILATTTVGELHQPLRAVTLAEKACVLTSYQTPGFLDTLGVAYAAAGRFPDAISITERIIQISTNSAQFGIVPLMNERLSLYKAGHAFQPTDNAPVAPPPIFLDLKRK